MDRALEVAFQFLIDQHGFVRLPGNGGCSYRTPSLTIEPSFNERDGFETHLLFPRRGTARVAVGTILSALDALEPHDVTAQTTFISLNLDKLADPTAEAYRDLAALQFWHAPRYRKLWGTSISLDRASIASEEARLMRLKQYFGTQSSS